MAEDAFMWIDAGAKPDIDGETTDDDMKKKKAFELTSWSIGAFNHQTIGSGTHGAGAGKGEYQDFVVTKVVDKASMALMQHALAGTHLKEVNVLVRRAGGTDQKQISWVEIKMLKVFVSSINFSGGAGMITESVSFGCGAIELKYVPQKADGGPDTPIPVIWSKVTNKPELKIG